MQNSIKTAQSQAGLDFAHTGDSRPTALNRAKKFILTLLALLTITTGAWAEETLLTTITASSDFQSGSKTFDNIATVTLDGNFYGSTDWSGDGETWQDLTLSEAKLTPGTYSITAKAADGTLYVNEAAGKFDIIEGYEVTVAAGEYITYYRDEALTLDEAETAAELYTISSVTDTEAQLSDKLDVVPAETPMLVFNNNNEDKTFLLIPTTTDETVSTAKEFKGTLEATTIPASTTSQDYYALNGKAFVWVKTAIEIGANKCWLQIGDQPAATRANTRSITGGGDTTGIKGTDFTDYTDGDYYDLNGRKVAQPNKKGIYIKNGQKVIIK